MYDSLRSNSLRNNSLGHRYGPGENFTHHDSYEKMIGESPDTSCWMNLMFGAALFAVGDATWESFPPGIIQVFYKEDDDKLKAASANYKLWQSMGFAIQFVLGVILANYFHAKLVILFVCLILCSIALSVLHFRVANLNSMSSDDGVDDVVVTDGSDYKPVDDCDNDDTTTF